MLSTVLELAGFVALIAAVYLLAGAGWALMLAGLLSVFCGFALDSRPVEE